MFPAISPCDQLPMGFQTMIIGPQHQSFPPATQYEMARETMNTKLKLDSEEYHNLPVINKTIQKILKVADCQVGRPRGTFTKGRKHGSQNRALIDAFNANRRPHGERLVYSSLSEQPPIEHRNSRPSGCHSTPPAGIAAECRLSHCCVSLCCVSLCCVSLCCLSCVPLTLRLSLCLLLCLT